MPRTKSATKALRQSLRKKARNIIQKTAIKAAVKKVVATKEKKSAAEALSHAYASVDKAAKNSVIHKNKAARLKSRLAKKIASIK